MVVILNFKIIKLEKEKKSEWCVFLNWRRVRSDRMGNVGKPGATLAPEKSEALEGDENTQTQGQNAGRPARHSGWSSGEVDV